ncbi:hypothetical protein BU26DRAFT_18988 [Trematosphaeria pertusa]|uniref:Uncharacterized protein n=1 Tax=Trematosphaeria pertusa TaxID=390896 RepID=A0A6A6J0F3_9PLEO|nr:uncharacterized protein BU26DRAFT_18988 [Trematosphaeria pertusa]KAF2256315.1 hypothetical protein BU26DRAFT_18988 [Trematosphaeria pertusa]
MRHSKQPSINLQSPTAPLAAKATTHPPHSNNPHPPVSLISSSLTAAPYFQALHIPFPGTRHWKSSPTPRIQLQPQPTPCPSTTPRAPTYAPHTIPHATQHIPVFRSPVLTSLIPLPDIAKSYWSSTRIRAVRCDRTDATNTLA